MGLLLQSMKLNLKELQAFRFGFLMSLIARVVDIFVYISFWLILFSGSTSVGDWSLFDILLLISFSQFYLGLFNLFFVSIFTLPVKIVNGRFDDLLILPHHPLHSLIATELRPNRLVSPIISSVLLLFSIMIHPSLSLDLFIIGFWISIVGAIVNNFLYAVINILAFWVGHIGYLVEIISETDNALYFPLTTLNSTVKFFFSFILPIYFIGTLPLEIIDKQITFRSAFYSILSLFFLLLFWIIAFRKLWIMGLKRYQSGGSL